MSTGIQVSGMLKTHIKEKIEYHNKLRLRYEASEDYEECVIHRDEIKRLTKMLEGAWSKT